MIHIKKRLVSTVLTLILTVPQITYSKDPNYYTLGLQAEFSGNTEEALEQYTLAAEKGLSDAKFALGRLYKDVFSDDENSFKWFKEAAEQGNVYAQYELGKIYRSDISPETDLALATKWFIHAAKEGKHGEAAFELFKISESDLDKLRWLRQSANQGIVQAMQLLGDAYNNGDLGLQVDTNLAQYWFTQTINAQE